MKAKFVTCYCLTVLRLASYFSEAFSNSLHFEDQFRNVTGMRMALKDDKFQSKLSPVGDYVFGSLLLLSCVLALVGNSCALTIFRFRQRALIPMEVFFINLSITNILLSVASYPLSIIASFEHFWNFKQLGCTIYAFSCYVLSLSSIYTITAMAFTRYLITCKPAQGSRVTCWSCCKMVAMGYLLAFILAAMPLIGFGNYEVEPFGLSCTLDWSGKDRASQIYIIVVTIFCVLLPSVVLIFSYSQIILLVKHSAALVKNTGVIKRKNGSSAHLTLICGLISAGFVVAWFPYTIVCLWASFKGELMLPIWATPAPCLFAKSSIVYNPIIYIFVTARYRKDFYEVFQCIKCKSSVTRKVTSHHTKIVNLDDGYNFLHMKPSIYHVAVEEHTV